MLTVRAAGEILTTITPLKSTNRMRRSTAASDQCDGDHSVTAITA